MKFPGKFPRIPFLFSILRFASIRSFTTLLEMAPIRPILLLYKFYPSSLRLVLAVTFLFIFFNFLFKKFKIIFWYVLREVKSETTDCFLKNATIENGF